MGNAWRLHPKWNSSKSGKILGDELGDWAIWSVVEQSSKQTGIDTSQVALQLDHYRAVSLQDA
jgi:hypothetical protein